ncbi:tail fiber domain-containing protein [Emticicia agri]|uniref:Peptidase S74 domain-containing protein n=1 Tax=Emticicia agri TaxID=2492393 RepID=A0A4Q5M152_9BACT|nr:tail fiber domain-containing protein [Emticicia agri]RYU96016.1 hypothetical protein EWM59_08955 [Emticicia agri]
MKKLLRHFVSFILFFNVFVFIASAQINTSTGEDQGITITPEGIKGRFPLSSEPTNVALGRSALRLVSTGTDNTAVGDRALYNNTKSYNTACGDLALYANTTGIYNSAFGANALQKNTIGYENVAIGAYALFNNTSLSKNVAIGTYSLFSQAYEGNLGENTAIGHSALYSNNPTDSFNGSQNTAVGNSALYFNKTGTYNVAIGYQASYNSDGGSDNMALGHKALHSNVSGSTNVAIGNEALYMSTGSGNVALGYRAGYNETGDNKLYIANSETNTPLIGGDFANKKLAINMDMTLTGPNDFKTRTEALQVGGEAFKTYGTGNWAFVSDRRLKKNIQYLNSREMLNKLMQMQGVTYQLKDGNDKKTHYGFIAQELREIFPEKIKENTAGYLSADYGSYDAILIEAIKAVNDNIEEVKVNIPEKETLYKQTLLMVENLEKRIQKLK